MEIAEGVHSISQPQGGQVHCFLLESSDGLTLIDSLWDNDGGRILAEIQRIGRQVGDLKHIVLTHAHRSHLGGLASLKELSKAEVFCHPWEVDIVEGDRVAQPVPILPMRPILAYYRVYPLQLGAALGLGKHPPCHVDVPIGGGDRVGPLQVLHTPGHTPGHLAFYWPERKIVFTGDTVVTYPLFSAGWPAFTLNGKQARASLCQLSELHVDVAGVGHGEAINGAAAERMHSLIEAADEQRKA
jgi:glyoxylase-like metal-dependent hydrolase (beta-lactamase superfamily II)